MRDLLERALFKTVGCLLTASCFWGTSAYRQHLIYARADKRHKQPNVSAIVAICKPVVPNICMAIANGWRSELPAKTGLLNPWSTVLAQIGDVRAVPTLIALTDHKDPWVRANAAFALATLRYLRSIPALNRLTRDSDKIVVEIARMALEYFE